eukprot:gene8994-biopygen623
MELLLLRVTLAGIFFEVYRDGYQWGVSFELFVQLALGFVAAWRTEPGDRAKPSLDWDRVRDVATDTAPNPNS